MFTVEPLSRFISKCHSLAEITSLTLAGNECYRRETLKVIKQLSPTTGPEGCRQPVEEELSSEWSCRHEYEDRQDVKEDIATLQVIRKPGAGCSYSKKAEVVYLDSLEHIPLPKSHLNEWVDCWLERPDWQQGDESLADATLTAFTAAIKQQDNYFDIEDTYRDQPRLYVPGGQTTLERCRDMKGVDELNCRKTD